MPLIKYPLLGLLLIAFVSIHFSCKDDDSFLNSNDCLFLTDINGNALGIHGNCPNQESEWGNSILSSSECDRFSFSPLTGAEQGPVNIERMVVFPNPVPANSSLSALFIADEEVVVSTQFIILDENQEVINETRYLSSTKATEEIIDAQDFSVGFTGGTYYELYYKVYIEGQTDPIFSGHGTILYCDEPNVPAVEDCLN